WNQRNPRGHRPRLQRRRRVVMAGPRVLYFFPNRLYPPRTGAHRRCLEMLAGLKEIGCNVHLVSSTLQDDGWDTSSVRALEAGSVGKVHIYRCTPRDEQLANRFYNFYAVSGGNGSSRSSDNHQKRTRFLPQPDPEILIRSYANCAALLA